MFASLRQRPHKFSRVRDISHRRFAVPKRAITTAARSRVKPECAPEQLLLADAGLRQDVLPLEWYAVANVNQRVCRITECLRALRQQTAGNIVRMLHEEATDKVATVT